MVSKLALEYLEVEADTLEFMVNYCKVAWSCACAKSSPLHHLVWGVSAGML